MRAVFCDVLLSIRLVRKQEASRIRWVFCQVFSSRVPEYRQKWVANPKDEDERRATCDPTRAMTRLASEARNRNARHMTVRRGAEDVLQGGGAFLVNHHGYVDGATGT